MSKELAEAVKLFISQPLNFPLSRGQIMEVARIALPILEQQKVMQVPAYYIVYHPNPDPHEYDDKEHSHCGSIHLARRLAGEIGGSICPVYIGEKLEQQDRGEEGWVEWGGDGIPVDDNVLVAVKWRNGAVFEGVVEEFAWYHDGVDNDIIAYRIIPEQPTNQNGE